MTVITAPSDWRFLDFRRDTQTPAPSALTPIIADAQERLLHHLRKRRFWREELETDLVQIVPSGDVLSRSSLYTLSKITSCSGERNQVWLPVEDD